MREHAPSEDPAARVAIRLSALRRIDPPPDLFARILARLPMVSRPSGPWSAEGRLRPALRWVQGVAGAAALVLLTLGLLGVAKAASRASEGTAIATSGRPATTGFDGFAAVPLGAAHRTAVVDDPGLALFAGSEPFDPFQPWRRGEPGGGP